MIGIYNFQDAADFGVELLYQAVGGPVFKEGDPQMTELIEEIGVDENTLFCDPCGAEDMVFALELRGYNKYRYKVDKKKFDEKSYAEFERVAERLAARLREMYDEINIKCLPSKDGLPVWKLDEISE
jgi:hypothetical protein